MILFDRNLKSTNEIDYLKREHLKLSSEQIKKKSRSWLFVKTKII